MLLRRLQPGDHDDVRRILLAAYADHLTGETSYAEVLTDLEGRERAAEVWVLVDDGPSGHDDAEAGAGAVVGTCTLSPPGSTYREIATDREGELRMLAVDPSRQGQGLGRAATVHAVEEVRRRGLDAVVLCTSTTMNAAHGLYESLGFVRIPERDWSPSAGIDLLAYRLELR